MPLADHVPDKLRRAARPMVPLARALELWSAAGGMRMSAAMSFYGILSLAPLLLAIVGILGWWMDRGTLEDGLDAIDALKAGFPAGTLSGAPKVRAMEIIDEVEPVRRGIYAGCAGYFAANGSMDTCITIRSVLMRGDTLTLQAGAGIVADSDPSLEFEESINKARAVAAAIQYAENGLV